MIDVRNNTDIRYTALMDAWFNGKPIEIWGILWRVSAMENEIMPDAELVPGKDVQIVTQFDLRAIKDDDGFCQQGDLTLYLKRPSETLGE